MRPRASGRQKGWSARPRQRATSRAGGRARGGGGRLSPAFGHVETVVPTRGDSFSEPRAAPSGSAGRGGGTRKNGGGMRGRVLHCTGCRERCRRGIAARFARRNVVVFCRRRQARRAASRPVPRRVGAVVSAIAGSLACANLHTSLTACERDRRKMAHSEPFILLMGELPMRQRLSLRSRRTACRQALVEKPWL